VTAGARTDGDTGRYYTHPTTGEQLVSVTTVLGATEGKPFLVDWSARLAAEYCVDNIGLIAELLANDGRQAAVDLAKSRAKQIRERKADAGSYVHAVAEALILWAASPDGTGRDIALPDLPEHLVDVDYDEQSLDQVVDWMVTGFTNFVAAFEPEFIAAEMTVYNRTLGVAGTLDMIIVLRNVALTADGRLIAAPGKRLVICVDIKTGRNLDITVREQIAAYRRCREALMPLGDVVPMPDTDAGAVLHLRPEHRDGYRLMPVSPAQDAVAWNRFRRAVEIFTGRAAVPKKPGKVAYPLREDGTMPAPRLADLDGEGYGRTLAPLIKSGLVDVEDVALLTAGQLLEIRGIGAKTADTVRQMLTDHGLSLADEPLQFVLDALTEKVA
jgi:hypothetical protein